MPRGVYPEALRRANELRRQTAEARRLEKRVRASTVINLPVGTLAGGYYIEDFTRHQLSTATAKNMSEWQNAYRAWLGGVTERMAEFRRQHKPYYTVQGERFYWVTDDKNLARVWRTGEAYELVFYGERQF